MNKLFTVSLSVLVLFTMVISGCSSVVKAFNDTSQVIKTGQNQEFSIALGSNITTGYSWQPQYDTDAFELVKKEYKENDTTGKYVVGAGGTEYFYFKATKTGNMQISFTYYRPWETPTSNDKTEVFNIIVN